MTINRIRKQPRRPHFIEEWAKDKGFDNQAELAEALDVDKSMISRWYSGATPNEESQKKLVALFHCEEPDAIFRHPSEDWFVRFFRGRSDEEVGRMQVLEAGWPPKPRDSH